MYKLNLEMDELLKSGKEKKENVDAIKERLMKIYDKDIADFTDNDHKEIREGIREIEISIAILESFSKRGEEIKKEIREIN